MNYSIEITIDAEKDIEKLKKSGDKKVLVKIIM
jgi:mRNA-degrading endonuclease RelE of RelBE toxin-antitoxin system